MTFVDISDFILDPFSESYSIDPSIFEENAHSTFYEDLLLEAADTKKKNVFQKLWGMIKKLFKWISNQFKKFINWIKNIFKRKDNKSSDQIMEDKGVKKLAGAALIGLAAYDIAAVGNDVNNPTPTPNPAPKANDTPRKIKVEIPADEHSEVKVGTTLDVAVKSLIAKFDGDKETVTFQFTEDFRYKDINGVPNKERVGNPYAKYYAFAWIKHPEVMDSFIKVFNYIRDNETIDQNALANLYNEYDKLADTALRSTMMYPKQLISCTLSELTEFNTKVDEINKLAEMLDTPNNVAKMNGNNLVVKIINEISVMGMRLQFSINGIFASMNEFYQVDALYYGTVKDINTLSEIVHDFIKAGIPYKYIAWNTYIIADDKIRGEAKKDKPVWGQTRVVFIAKDHSCVHKIAMNQAGIRSNLGEAEVYNKFSKIHGGSDVITKVYRITPNNCIVDHEWVDTTKSDYVDQSTINRLTDRMNHLASSNDIPLDFKADIHNGNIGYRGNTLVATDYGLLRRLNTK